VDLEQEMLDYVMSG